MQNVSREDYLASLRRKSSGFSRGISKYRPLSSINYGAGDSNTSEHDYIGGFCIDRKIDLSNYIKWWGVNQSAKETKGGCPEDIASELKAPEWSIQHTEPYEMPRLGVTIERKEEKRSKYSALSILSSSEPFRSFQENALKLRRQEDNENDENENKNIIHKTEHGKALENPALEGVTDRLGIAFGRDGGLTIQRNMFVSNPLISGSLPSSYNTVNTLTDPVLWTPLAPPSLPLGSSRADEVTKNEPSSDYAFFQPEV
ncbi:hypothetical protein Leryth_018471 [Lithospermum erythrorhizon]|nr:hypothetical protein Leryth_018471 [Lithospermum erythrorhizon]